MPVAPGTYDYYLAPWQYVTDSKTGDESWVFPTGTVGGIDLRSIPDMSRFGGTPHGFAFVALDPAAPAPSKSISINNNLAAAPNAGITNGVETALGLTRGDLSGGTLLEIITAILTEYSDPTGSNLCKPLMPTKEGNLDIHLRGHSLIKRERYQHGTHAHATKVQELIDIDFQKAKERSLSFARGNSEYLHYRKLLGAWEQKFQISGLMAGEAPLPPETVHTDTFTDSDSTQLTSHTFETSKTWTTQEDTKHVIISNSLQRPGGGSDWDMGWVDQALSSDDHSAEATTANTPGGGSRFVGLITRKATGATETAYYFGLTHLDGTEATRCRKIVAGSTTTFASPSHTETNNFTYKLDSNGSTQTYEVPKGTTVHQQTDSAITGNTLVGVIQYSNSIGNLPHSLVDNFVGDDGLGAGGGSTTSPNSLRLNAGRLGNRGVNITTR